jgi:NAD(P)-dependent dehydrogenase (short-subunit alcohol dehydrogenase family)
MDLALDDRVAIVTGGSKGIGYGCAEALAAEGCTLSICARHRDELEAAAADLEAAYGVAVEPVVADLTVDDDIDTLVERTIDAFGTVDVLVNNAGTVGTPGGLDDNTTQDWRDLFELNLFAVVTLTRTVVPHMREQGWGRIINISSENGEQPYPDMMAYSASKGALNNFGKALSKEVADDGILVNTVSPAFIETPLVNEMMAEAAEAQDISVDEMVEQFLAERRPHIEVGRPGEIEEVGSLVAFLASEHASFVNGANYRVDGGSVAAM